jgi:uncharacterized membrane protein
MMYGYSFGAGGALMMVFSVFAIALVVWLVLTLGQSRVRDTGGPNTALRMLEERLARGEIDADEFRGRRAAIADAKS